MVGYDGSVLAFVEVKTRTMPNPHAARSSQTLQRTPEDAVNWEKRRNLSRMARQFLRARHIECAECRFDVLAIETRPGAKPRSAPAQRRVQRRPRLNRRAAARRVKRVSTLVH